MKFLNPKKKLRPKRLRLKIEREKGKKFLPFIIGVLVSGLVLSFPLSLRSFSLRPGKSAPFDIRAFRTVQYIDEEKTEALRAEAAYRVSPQFIPLPFAKAEAEDNVRNTFQLLKTVKARGGIISEEIEKLSSRLPITLSISAINTLLQTQEDLNQLEEKTLEIVRLVMQENIKDTEEDLRVARERARVLSLRTFPRTKETLAIAEIAANSIKANLIIDEAATRKLRERARSSVKPVYERIMFGEMIVRKGEKITPEIWNRLSALGIVGKLPPLREILTIYLLIAVSYLIILLFLSRYKQEVFHTIKLQSLLWLLLFLGFLGFKLGISFQYTPAIVSAFLGISLASLLGGETAAIALPFFSLLLAVSAGGEMEIAGMSILAGSMGTVSTLRIRERFDLVKASLALAGIIILATLVLHRWESEEREWIFLALFWGVVSGVIGIAVSWLGVSILERLFGITTTFQLLELTNPEKPLLRELLLNAPGSYQHSIITANLAEAAATVVGADALLCRVSALYHDIGKVKRPLYFIENQLAENIHENLTPSLSSLVIISHVRDGVEMAKMAKLPPKVIEIIAQHHGTSLVTYFYHRALGEMTEVVEERFRYEGPKPQSKEAGIVMLADAVEAAVRSLVDKSPSNVEAIVDRVIRMKLEDGQLDESGLSIKDLKEIKSAFLAVLRGLLHKRLEYPSAEEIKVASQNNSSGKNQNKKASDSKDS